MAFTESEIEYLAGQRLGRLATLRPDGTLQNSPVSYRYDAGAGTIDITGYNLTASRKFRNVAATGQVAFVVDDLPSVDPWRVRCLEVRGTAEAIESPAGSAYDAGVPIIRIHPRQIISFGLDQSDVDPHQLVSSNRHVA
ncbi:PPOX class F420-dependent oxidoreductase [Winogradskya consettensis]|uniref:PPOX class F420-dependent oxidoreductase n=1 Tax=Winogradskya consettensis TaxID=113560 RepID=A0A919SD44_9ACTN|nr:PPOX class F420-dependent oxidoreductase [Actinoplanes consettensis]GIM69646.1 PPOX class F420-dependent oxidoreductase [Actinoplanes consettensis]